MKSKAKGREYTLEFKETAARRMLAGESSTALSRELDVQRSLLYRWRDAYRAEGVGGLSRKSGRPPAGSSRRAQPSTDWRDERIAQLERLVGRQAAELDSLKNGSSNAVQCTPDSGASASRSTGQRATPTPAPELTPPEVRDD